MTWDEPKIFEGRGRSLHTCHIVGDLMYIHGGTRQPAETPGYCGDEIMVYNLETSSWLNLTLVPS